MDIRTPQVLKPAITLAGVTALSHAFENKLLKLNLVITLPAETGGKQFSIAFLKVKIHHNLTVEPHVWYAEVSTKLLLPFL